MGSSAPSRQRSSVGGPVRRRDKTFTVLLIGKDGTEKLRADTVPNLQTVYAVIDGMPMRGREMSGNNSEC